MNSTRFDLIVIGAGPGGYTAAIRAAQLGLRTACIDKRGKWGGTCLNIGCIPSKALLQSSHKYEEARSQFASHGIRVEGVALDLEAMMARKDAVVADLTKGIDFLFKKNDVTGIAGEARITGPGVVTVTDGEDAETYSADNILVATGSEAASLPGIEIDEDRIVSSTGALSLSRVPEHLVVIGAGYIGLEMGSVWQRLGAKVTVVEFLDSILPGMDSEIAGQLHRLLRRQGLTFRLGTRVVGAASDSNGVSLAISGDGKEDTISADMVLMSVGRRPCTDNLGLDEVGVARDDKGTIQVDETFETSVPGIYAIGDAVPGPMLAHKAEEEGVACVEHLAGHSAHVNYGVIPAVVYTWPEAAAVGQTEDQVKETGLEYRVGRFPFSANSRARANSDTPGVVKLITSAETDQLLGAHILGPEAGTMIGELAVAMEFGASAEDIARTCHAHPTLNEAIKEAALDAWSSPIHI